MEEDVTESAIRKSDYTQEIFEHEIRAIKQDAENQLKEMYIRYEQSQKECEYLRESLKRLLKIY